MQTKTLFSQYYLDTRLPEHAEWTEDPTPVFETLRALWAKAQQFGDAWSEAQTEDEFIKPALTALGWSFIVQPTAKHGGRVTRPDYALFADEATQQAAYAFQGDNDAFYNHSLAIAEAKFWGRALSQKDSSGRESWKTGENPSHQMVSYLVGTRAPWGILTNGQVWRLYSREVSSTASEFYEVDLGEIMNHESRISIHDSLIFDSFRRFWLFFRQAAFIPDAQGKSFVQRVHEGSATYAREISDKLKELVYAEVMPEIAGGFIAYRRERMGVYDETEESLRDIYRASLSLLYKLLFLLYAEARGLLPVDNPGYREQSLTALAQWAAARIDAGQPLSTATHATSRYESLLALFHRIDQGDPSLGIPRYNGGLFNPQNPDNVFLEQHRLSDRAVARAVDILVRDAGQPVDYAYISVRNLGAIYEGLLENKLRVMDAAAGRVELVNDKGERKATGSYYTPDYIVEYIVQQTLGPIIEARAEIFAAAMERVAEARRALARTADPGKVRLLRPQLDAAERDAREAFLGIKVLDPAMGSGHFLVNAVDFLTDGIIQRMQIFHGDHLAIPWEWNPIQQLVERVRREILAEITAQGIALDPARLDDTALLTRLVMKRCIYGVDLNKMAVELAKLSLWLHSFTVGAPLSFLDHHLRWGNSLIGTDVRTVEAGIQMTDTGQFGLFAGPFAGLLDLTTLMVEVVDRADATLSDVQRSAGDFAALQKSLTPYKQALDLWVSRHFGNPEADELLRLYGDDVLPALRGEKQVSERHQAVITRARDLWAEKRFFHWDLEFPEVFVDLQKRDWAENPGFDAVIGNPPYDVLAEKERKENLSSVIEYFGHTSKYAPASGGKLDLYRLFVSLAFEVTRPLGQVGLILPMSLLADQQTKNLRKVILEFHTLLVIEAFPQKDDPNRRIFYEAKLPTCVLIAARGFRDDYRTLLRVHPGNLFEETSGCVYLDKRSLLLCEKFFGGVPLATSSAELELLLKLHNPQFFCSMGDELFTYQGEINATTHAEYLSEDPKSGPRIYRGGNIQRYEFIEEAKQGAVLYLCADAFVDDKRGSKAKHIDQKRFGYQRKAALDNWRRLIFCELPDPPCYCIESISYFLNFGIRSYFLLSLLNSKLLEWRFEITSSNNMISTTEISALPLPLIKHTTPAEERARLLTEGQALAAAWVQQPDAAATPYGDFRASPLGAWLAPPIQNQKSTIQNPDVVHDLLAALAEEMLALNRDKQTEMRGFLVWLERHIGAKLDDLMGKTIIQNYLGDYQKGKAPLAFDELLKRLRQNRRKLTANPDARAFQEQLAQEHADSLGKLLPLKRRLAATDRLIDLLVYRLYGLTEEEVGIVEGRVSARSRRRLVVPESAAGNGDDTPGDR